MLMHCVVRRVSPAALTHASKPQLSSVLLKHRRLREGLGIYALLLRCIYLYVLDEAQVEVRKIAAAALLLLLLLARPSSIVATRRSLYFIARHSLTTSLAWLVLLVR